MSHPAQLVSLVPPAPLTDEVFPFNRPAFLEIQRYQQESVSCSYIWNFMHSRTIILFQRFSIFAVAGDYFLPLGILETNVLKHIFSLYKHWSESAI